MGNENGDGMDGGLFGNQNWGGGRFSFEFFFQNQSCETGVLKTDDDNWEKGQINYFVGHQIGSCENFPLDSIGKNTNIITYQGQVVSGVTNSEGQNHLDFVIKMNALK